MKSMLKLLQPSHGLGSHKIWRAPAEPLGDMMKRYGQSQGGVDANFTGPAADKTSQRLSTSSVSDLDMTPSLRCASMPCVCNRAT